jgi:hypothetical protein
MGRSWTHAAGGIYTPPRIRTAPMRPLFSIKHWHYPSRVVDADGHPIDVMRSATRNALAAPCVITTDKAYVPTCLRHLVVGEQALSHLPAQGRQVLVYCRGAGSSVCETSREFWKRVRDVFHGTADDPGL